MEKREAIFSFLVRRQSDIEAKKRTAYLMFQHQPEKEIFGSLVEELSCECARTSVDFVFASATDALRLGYFLNFCIDCSLVSNLVTLKTCVQSNLAGNVCNLEDLLREKIHPAMEDIVATRASGSVTRQGQSLLFPQIVQALIRHEEAFKPLYVYYSTSEKVRLSHQIQTWEDICAGSATTQGLSYANAVQMLKDFKISPGLMTYLDYSEAFYNGRQGTWGDQVSFLRVASMDMGAATGGEDDKHASGGEGSTTNSLLSFAVKTKQARTPTFAQIDAIQEEEGNEVAMVNPAESMGHIERVLRLFYHDDANETRRIQHTTVRIRQALGNCDKLRYADFDEHLRIVESRNRVLDNASLSLPEFMLLTVDFARIILGPKARASLSSLYEAEDADELATAAGKFHSLLQLLSHHYEVLFNQELVQADTMPVEQTDDQLPAVQTALNRQLRRVFAGYAARDDPLGLEFISWESFHLFAREAGCFKALKGTEIQNIAIEASSHQQSGPEANADPKALSLQTYSKATVSSSPRASHHRPSLLEKLERLDAPCKLDHRGRMSFDTFCTAVERLLFAQARAEHGAEVHMDQRWYQDGSRSSRGISPEGKIKRAASTRLRVLYELYQPASRGLGSSARLYHTKTGSPMGPQMLLHNEREATASETHTSSGSSKNSKSNNKGFSSSGQRRGSSGKRDKMTPQELLHNHKLRLATQQVTEANNSKTVWGALLGLTQNERSQEAAASNGSGASRRSQRSSQSPVRRRSSISRQENIRELRDEVDHDFTELIEDIGAQTHIPAKPSGSPRERRRFRSSLQSPRARARNLKTADPHVAHDPIDKRGSQFSADSTDDSSTTQPVFHLTMQEDLTGVGHLSRTPSQQSHDSNAAESGAASICSNSSVIWTSHEEGPTALEAADARAEASTRWPLSRFPLDEEGKLRIDGRFDSLQLITAMGRELESSEGAKRHADRFGEIDRPRVTFRTAAAPTYAKPRPVLKAAGDDSDESSSGNIKFTEKNEEDLSTQAELVAICEGPGIQAINHAAEENGLQLSPRHSSLSHETVQASRPLSACIRASRAVVNLVGERKRIQARLESLLGEIYREKNMYIDTTLAQCEPKALVIEDRTTHLRGGKASSATVKKKSAPSRPSKNQDKAVTQRTIPKCVEPIAEQESFEEAFVACFKRGKRDKSISKLEKAYAMASQVLDRNPRLVMAVLRELVALKRHKGDLLGAEADAEKLLHLCADDEFIVLRCHVLAAKAQIQLQRGAGLEAELTERDRLALATSYALGETTSDATDFIGETKKNGLHDAQVEQDECEDADECRPILERKVGLPSQRAAQTGVGPSLATIGTALRMQGKFDEAIEMHEHHLKYALAARRWEDHRRALMDKATTLSAAGENESAHKTFATLLDAQKSQHQAQSPSIMLRKERIEMLACLVQVAMKSPRLFKISLEAIQELELLAESVGDRSNLAFALEAKFKACMLDVEGRDLRPALALAHKLILSKADSRQKLLQLRTAVQREDCLVPEELKKLVSAEEALGRAIVLDEELAMRGGPDAPRQRLERLRALLID
ncbi:Hypothetical Protein FCC1311_000432 [Hondaea fermentalgiana]|uniref:Uncharacterized protein n=1 Tax=Hondaea fermentalgiana TaxID=2315210 RepID=A0A2R5G5U9_9STRA|nr:Hypothetical Protein FCC1311_000432 [Hondaea fermentalgiana]|eukprot:GBG23823.1 Hypothetical Protein FCC1311_000432 [Hondaea fermentalgiana]